MIKVGGGNDADYYNAIATGQLLAGSLWGRLLIILNENGIYSRVGLSFLNCLLSVLVVPFLVYKIVKSFCVDKISVTGLFVFAYICVYPTLAFYSVDIYRDVVMVVLFLYSVFSYKSCLIQEEECIKGILRTRIGSILMLSISVILLFLSLIHI